MIPELTRAKRAAKTLSNISIQPEIFIYNVSVFPFIHTLGKGEERLRKGDEENPRYAA